MAGLFLTGVGARKRGPGRAEPGWAVISGEAKSPWIVALITLMHDFAAICNL